MHLCLFAIIALKGREKFNLLNKNDSLVAKSGQNYACHRYMETIISLKPHKMQPKEDNRSKVSKLFPCKVFVKV